MNYNINYNINRKQTTIEDEIIITNRIMIIYEVK